MCVGLRGLFVAGLALVPLAGSALAQIGPPEWSVGPPAPALASATVAWLPENVLCAAVKDEPASLAIPPPAAARPGPPPDDFERQRHPHAHAARDLGR